MANGLSGMQADGFKVAFLHGGLSKPDQLVELDKIRSGQVRAVFLQNFYLKKKERETLLIF
jgi:hypothetical protein